jgi:hypothetical protein
LLACRRSRSSEDCAAFTDYYWFVAGFVAIDVGIDFDAFGALGEFCDYNGNAVRDFRTQQFDKFATQNFGTHFSRGLVGKVVSGIFGGGGWQVFYYLFTLTF